MHIERQGSYKCSKPLSESVQSYCFVINSVTGTPQASRKTQTKLYKHAPSQVALCKYTEV